MKDAAIDILIQPNAGVMTIATNRRLMDRGCKAHYNAPYADATDVCC